MNKKLPVGRPKVYKKKEVIHGPKLKLSKTDMEFLKNYAMTNSKPKAMIAAGLNFKKDGTEYSQIGLYERANCILRNDKAQEYVKRMQEEILKSNCLSIEKAVNESYQFYELLIREGKYHEANICYQRITDLLKLTTQGLSVNTQIVDTSGKGITINYINPKENLDNK